MEYIRVNSGFTPSARSVHKPVMRLARPGMAMGLALAVLLVLSSPLKAQVGWRPVLVLASDHSQSRFEQQQIAGLCSTLPPDAEVIFEYLDSKRMNRRQHYFQLYETILHAKYGNRELAAIVALNDDAIRVVNYYRTNIFSQSPLIVCGSSLAIMGDLPGLSNWTGVFSEPNMEATILWALKLHPDAQTVHIVADLTPVGRLARERLTLAAESGRFSVPIVVPEKDSSWNVSKQIRDVQPESVVFFAELYKDESGKVYLPQHLVTRLSSSLLAPIYTSQSDAVGVGAVGGYVVNGRMMGCQAGEMVKRVLANESPSNIPPVVLAGEWLFDDAQLKRWGIAYRSLPKGARIINRPISYYEKNRRLLWTGGMIVMVEAAIIGLLLWNRVARIRAQQALKTSEKKYRGLFETSEDLFMILDEGGAIVHANPATCRVLGYSLGELVGRALSVFVVAADRVLAWAQQAHSLGGSSTPVELRCLASTGEEIPTEFLFQQFESAGKVGIACLARNLSERINLQRLTQEISERERQAIGHDIHDGLGQYLTAMLFQCHRLEQGAAASRPPNAGELAKLSAIAKELAFEVRGLARSMVPLQMQARTLESAVQELLEINRRHFSIDAALVFALEENRLLPDAAAQVYRIVQEAVRNAVRHGGAKTVRVALRSTSECNAELTVANDGRPFKLLPELRPGLGLAIMEQRARLIRGTLKTTSGEGPWTQLLCRFPIAPCQKYPES